jgi:hypothetical protein
MRRSNRPATRREIVLFPVSDPNSQRLYSSKTKIPDPFLFLPFLFLKKRLPPHFPAHHPELQPAFLFRGVIESAARYP